jgi:threonine dehydratase
MIMTTLAITFDDIREASARIVGGIADTPAQYSHVLSKKTGADIHLKYETFQYTGSFKERGVLNRLLTLSEDEKSRGVIAVSAGNHAQAVARHATRLGIPATIVMPIGTPFNKIKKTEDLGATVVLAGSAFTGAAEHAATLQKEQNLTNVHTFDDPMIMAGHGTVGMEFLEKFPDLECLIVPIGGGGIMSGIAVAAKAINPNIKLFGVQSEVYPAMKAAIAGETIQPSSHTIAEGIAIKIPGKLTQAVVEELVEDILVVKEVTIERAMNMMVEIEKVVVEGAGATGLAAVLENTDIFKGKKTGIVITGGNIDPRIMASSIMRGMARDGRLSQLTVKTPDLPGGLARLTAIIATMGGNVLEVYHTRQFASIGVKYTEITIEVETKDMAHRDALIAKLDANDFEVRLREVLG